MFRQVDPGPVASRRHIHEGREPVRVGHFGGQRPLVFVQQVNRQVGNAVFIVALVAVAVLVKKNLHPQGSCPFPAVKSGQFRLLRCGNSLILGKRRGFPISRRCGRHRSDVRPGLLFGLRRGGILRRKLRRRFLRNHFLRDLRRRRLRGHGGRRRGDDRRLPGCNRNLDDLGAVGGKLRRHICRAQVPFGRKALRNRLNADPFPAVQRQGSPSCLDYADFFSVLPDPEFAFRHDGPHGSVRRGNHAGQGDPHRHHVRVCRGQAICQQNAQSQGQKTQCPFHRTQSLR